MATRNDVAKRAGVSAATVSHVVNGTKFVSPELKTKVDEAIRVLQYQPNIIARSLVTKTTKHVGVLVDNVKNPYYAEIIEGMEEVAHRNGYVVSLMMTRGDTENYFENNLMDLIRRQMDGLLNISVVYEPSSEQLRALHEQGIKLVNGHGYGPDIGFEYAKAIDDMLRYLKQLGHSKVGFITGMARDFMMIESRYHHFIEGLKKYDLVYDEELIVFGQYPFETTHRSGYDAMKELLDRQIGVTAVFAINDLMAYGAMKAIREYNYKIPQDISVIGCDDIFLNECVDPPLTSLRVPKKQMGRKAMELLLFEIQGKPCKAVLLEADFMVRKSTESAKK